jgi:hypothetical protein
VQSELPGSSRYGNYKLGRRLVVHDGFYVLKENLTRSRKRLSAIAALDEIEKQFIGTLVDTEMAAGYFLVTAKGNRRRWTAYVSVKMKYGGDVAYFSKLVGLGPPNRSLNANTIMNSLDPRWSKQVQGVVAYALVKAVRPYLHNEKSIIEVDCILRHGPRVPPERPHPFVECGAIRMKRGVWHWPQIDD